MSTNPVGAAVAVIPLIGNDTSDDNLWVGAILARVLSAHLTQIDIEVLDHNTIAAHLTLKKNTVPLDQVALQSLHHSLKVNAVVHGRYLLDEVGKMLGFRLLVDAPNVPAIPIEASAPLTEFGRFLERVTLSIVDQIGKSIDDEMRQRVTQTIRPASFEALRQLARAYGAWSRDQKELALTAVSSALAIDPDFEEAAALDVAIARQVHDKIATRNAFRRWSTIAEKQGQPRVAAERLLMLGHWLFERGEWDDARKAYDDTRTIFQRLKDDVADAKAINNIANLEMARGKYQNAIQAYRRNLRVMSEHAEADQSDVAGTLYNLSLAHKNLGQDEEAERAVEEALTEARSTKNNLLEARCFTQRGALHDLAGRWAQANIDYSQAARLFDALGDERGLAFVKTQQGVLLKHQGDYNRAESLLRQAQDALEKLHDQHELAVIWVNLADLYLSMGNYDDSWDYAERALNKLSELKSGWRDRAQEIIDTLDSLPEEAPPAEESDQVEDQSSHGDGSLDVSDTVVMVSRFNDNEDYSTDSDDPYSDAEPANNSSDETD